VFLATLLAAVPLLAPAPYLSIDRDLPAPVKARIGRVVNDYTERARAAAKLPTTAANGCVASGPPAPHVSSHVIGHHIEVRFDFARFPESPACSPFQLDAVVLSSSNNYVGHFWLSGRRGRVVLDLPWSAKAPYRLIVYAESILGRRSRPVQQALRCPSGGCLPGYRPALHSWPMPKPVLPVRGLDRAGLEASLEYALAGERVAPIVNAVPRSSSCSSLKVCDVAYVDPAFPDSPYRVRYRIAGQQVPGCWMGMRGSVLDARPFDDAFTGRLELAACVSWLKS
jgi:hypothetical protein